MSRREIILAAGNDKQSAPWLQSLRVDFQQMDSWQKRAFLFAVRQLPKDERKFWIGTQLLTFSLLEKCVANASKAY